MRINAFRYRHLRAKTVLDNRTVRLHLGPGQHNYFEGWVNVDANMFTGRCDLWADLRNPLPFPANSVDACYSHHVIEHLPDTRAHFADIFRVLKPGGIYRVGGPNGDAAIQKFAEKDLAWFSNFPDNYTSIGGKLVNFIFCRNEHLTLLTESLLNELAEAVGFAPGRVCMPTRETGAPDLFAICVATEHENDFETPHTLILEFTKPNDKALEKGNGSNS